jgi:hypothetical protein
MNGRESSIAGLLSDRTGRYKARAAWSASGPDERIGRAEWISQTHQVRWLPIVQPRTIGQEGNEEPGTLA